MFHLDTMTSLRGTGAVWSGLPGVPLSLNVFGPMFGDDPKVAMPRRSSTSIPACHRFLILGAENVSGTS